MVWQFGSKAPNLHIHCPSQAENGTGGMRSARLYGTCTPRRIDERSDVAMVTRPSVIMVPIVLPHAPYAQSEVNLMYRLLSQKVVPFMTALFLPAVKFGLVVVIGTMVPSFSGGTVSVG